LPGWVSNPSSRVLTRKLIKGDRWEASDPWQWVGRAVPVAQLPAGPVLVPLALWHHHRAELRVRLPDLGLWLESSQGPEEIGEDPNAFPVIALDFPQFVDGRSYSHARLLRERHGYRGQLRAIGEVLCDQLYYMCRCGFDAFCLREDQDLEVALRSLKAFSDSYQAAVDQPLPRFRRR